MSWKRILIDTHKDAAEQLSDQLTELGACAVSMESATEEKVFGLTPNDAPLWTHTRITALFSDASDTHRIAVSLQAQAPNKLAMQHDTLEDQDWVRITQAHFPPRCFADALWVYPGWHQETKKHPHITLDPGLAFGTGTHPTTALCLAYLVELGCDGKNVIDYGCGSGILALSAARLGAQHVWATDHDPQAMEATTNNAGLNPELLPRLSIQMPAPATQKPVPLVVANILSEALISLKNTLAAWVKPEGDLILSGLLAEEVDKIQAHYPDFELVSIKKDEGWVALHLKRL